MFISGYYFTSIACYAGPLQCRVTVTGVRVRRCVTEWPAARPQVEYMVLRLDREARTARLSLRSPQLLDQLQATERKDPR